jgi:hypothetical protein
MKLSFRKFLETGEMPPFIFGMKRDEIVQRLGKPSSWASNDEGIGPSRRDYLSSDSISYGSLAFAFEEERLAAISITSDLMRNREWSYPVEVVSFPQRETTLAEIASYMRRLEVSFEDVSPDGDGSVLKSAGGVTLVSWPGAKGLLSCCSSKAPKPNKAPEPTPGSVTSRAD